MERKLLIFIVVLAIVVSLKPVRLAKYFLFHYLEEEVFVDRSDYNVVKDDADSLDIESLLKDGTLLENINKTYSNSEIKEIEKLKSSISYLNSKYKIEYLKKRFYGSGEDFYYDVYYMSNNKYLVVSFTPEGKKFHNVTHKFSRNKSFFENLKIGDKDMFDLMLKDKNGEYGYFDIPSGPGISNKYSSHYTKDGYFVFIKYDDNYKIKEVNIEPI